jgi:hypothetical protein
MRQKSTNTTMQGTFLRVFLVVIALTYLVECLAENPNVAPSESTSGLPPLHKMMLPSFFSSVQEIKGFLKKERVPADIKEVAGKSDRFCFICAYPYSGEDTTDLYCFVWRGEGWLKFLSAGIWSAPPGTLEFVVDGDFVDVKSKGVVVLKLNPPK